MIRNRVLAKCSLIFLAVCLAFTTSACTVADNIPDPSSVKAADNIDSKVAHANNEFALHLYDELNKLDQGGENIFICPTSIVLALSMTYNGADGDTKAAMAETLKIQGISLDELNKENFKLRSILQNADKDVTLEIANAIWARKDMEFNADFIKRNSDYYDAHVEALDFSHSKASKVINDWVRKATHKKIDGIVDDNIDPNTVMFLINAIYFNGDWAKPFKPKNTQKVSFTNIDGSKTHVQMMFQSDGFKYLKEDKFQSVALPYGNKRISMYVFLPNEDFSLDEFYDSLTMENWNDWMSRFTRTEGNIGLPKIKLEYKKNLNDVLKAMGMEVAFDEDRADFGLMFDRGSLDENLYIGNVQHKTFLQIDEEGAEAAGVTSVEKKSESSQPLDDEKFTMIMDRPFFFVIQDDITGVVLFMGSINKL